MSTYTVEVKVKLVISTEDRGYGIGQVVDEMVYDFKADTPGVTILDTEILDYEIKDLTRR